MAQKAIFLDRDGVITQPIMKEGKAFSARQLHELTFIDEALPAIQKFIRAGFVLVVVTNQPDIARKDMEEHVLLQMHQKIEDWAGGPDVLKRIYYCPHDDADECGCRKPKPGMLHQAAQDWDIDIRHSYLIGDRDRDIHAGKAAGCRTVLIDMPYNQSVSADFRARNIREACDWILERA